jgi:hypothetical protein
MAPALEYLSHKQDAMNSNPNTTKKVNIKEIQKDEKGKKTLNIH